MVDSLNAAFRAGRISADVWVDGMSALANHDSWDVTSTVANRIEGLLTQILEDEGAEQAEIFGQNLFNPIFEARAQRNGVGDTLVRQALQRYLIVIARDPEMRAPLSKMAADYIGMEGTSNPSAIPPTELETALSVGVQDLGEPFFDKLSALVKSTSNPSIRSNGAGALARVENPALSAKLLSDVLAGDYDGSTATGILFRQMVRGKTRESTFAWLKANSEKVFEILPSTVGGSAIPGLGRSFCSHDKADEWKAFVEENGERLTGYERSLAQALESISLCAALQESRRDELIAALAK
jgi:hypothetical protein